MTPVATAIHESDWFKALIYVVIAVVVARVVDYALARRDRAMLKLLGKTPDRADRTRYVMIRRLVFFGIVFVGAGIALVQIPQVDTLARAMLASAAIVAGVIGIAARAPIANLVSGVMIAFSQPVRLNDFISVDGEFGTVEKISLLYTYIRSPDGRRVVLPNEAFAMKAVHNYSLDSSGCAITVDLALPLGADVERIMQTMREVGETLAPAPAGTEAGVELADVSGAGTLLRLHVWAADPLHRREIASDVRLALLRRLTADGLVGAEEDGADP